MARKYCNSVKFSTATIGQGAVAVGPVYGAAYLTPAQAGAATGDDVVMRIEEGNDWEIVRGAYDAAGPTVSRDTVLVSKIAGVVGATKMTLAGAAVVNFVEAAQDFAAIEAGALRFDVDQTPLSAASRSQLYANAGIVDPISSAFVKADWKSVGFVKTAAGAISIKAGTTIGLNGLLYTYAADTAVQMPTLNAGTDYAIYQCNDGTLRADASFTAPSGFTAGHVRQIGGFHYAPGGNATGTSGGDTTPAINEYSIWDIKFRPACSDPRGMTLVSGRFWCDIYLLGVNHHTDGPSKYNVTIADGSSPPKIPTAFGGNGSTTYSTLTWWEAAEVLAAYGRDLLCYGEFAAAGYGSTENSSAGTDPVSTVLRNAYTSKWGVMLATGNMWVWGRDVGGPYNTTAAWQNNNGGRGQTYSLPNAVLLGGSWVYGANSGSRASSWIVAPSSSNDLIGARGRCDHLRHV